MAVVLIASADYQNDAQVFNAFKVLKRWKFMSVLYMPKFFSHGISIAF